MKPYTSIMLPLGRDEFQALRELSDREYRHPREQARYLLRQALGLADGETGPTSPIRDASDTGPVGSPAGVAAS